MAEATIIPCSLVTNHPLGGDKPLSWNAQIDRVHDDIMVVRDAFIGLDNLAEIAEQHAELFTTSDVIGLELEEQIKPEDRRSDKLLLGGDECPDDLKYYGLMCQTIEGQFIRAYLDSVNPHAHVAISSNYELLRYKPGGYFREHVDIVRDHPVLGHRRLSIIAFCNDDYEGGELYFPRQDLTIKPESGLLVLFPSSFTHPHEGKTVTKGIKYSIVAWYY
jgi:hypothetical protein